LSGVAWRTGASSTVRACRRFAAMSAGIEHIVYIQFDNVHFRRDNPNVSSDLEQIPNLLNFL
jgi:hypothetical protein